MARRATRSDLGRLLAAWVDDVDELARHDEARLRAGVVGVRPRARRLPRAASAVLAASAALMSASGVAAAVTGDPLAVYRPAIDSLLRDEAPAEARPDVMVSRDQPAPAGPGAVQPVHRESPAVPAPAVPAPAVPALAVTSSPAPSPAEAGVRSQQPASPGASGVQPGSTEASTVAPPTDAVPTPTPTGGDGGGTVAVVEPQATAGTLTAVDPAAGLPLTSPGTSGSSGPVSTIPPAPLP